MPTTITTRMDADYLVIEGEGVIEDAKDEEAFATRCYEEILKQSAKQVLIDQRNITFNSTVLDQCDVVSHYMKEFEVKIRVVRIAIIVLPEDEALHEFWEVYANNRGYPWKVFTEMEDAVGFLTA